ncbi:MAG: MFS transporter, partial [Lachnospiraceae bacterium]|nr:MFS transporter [Lachnospiraceae bacterium]
MRFLQQYKNLSKEIYILFFGRIVTSMGSLIWPIMTLILKNKLGYSATMIATISMVMGIVQLPMVLLGGKVADSLNRKWVIICCDMVTVICFFICGIIPLSIVSVVLFYVAGVFATIEGPSYDAIVADLSDGDSREHAYSLQYLGGNLGLVLAPTLGGLLLKHYLNVAFFITSIATFSSTILIFFFVKRLQVEKKNISKYEEKQEGARLWDVLKERKTFFLYFIATGLAGLVYSQFNYLLPLNMEHLYGADGATWFGMMTSVNGFVVVVGTPVITAAFGRIKDVRKMV